MSMFIVILHEMESASHMEICITLEAMNAFEPQYINGIAMDKHRNPTKA